MAEQQLGEDDEMSASDDETYEVLEVMERAQGLPWWCKVFTDKSGPVVEKYSFTTQIATGGVIGWCAGSLCQRVGKIAVTAVGGGFLLLQIANHTGYVQVNWKKVQNDVSKAKRHLKSQSDKSAHDINTTIEEAVDFMKRNIVLSSGFVGGFLLGLAF